MLNRSSAPQPNRSNALQVLRLRSFIYPLFACASLIVSAHAVYAQSSVSPGGALIVGNAELPTPLNQLPDANIQMMKHQHQANQKRFDAINLLRRQRISDETAELLTLARDLKTKLDRVGNDQLPPALVRESEIIELLARDVQEKMVVTVQ